MGRSANAAIVWYKMQADMNIVQVPFVKYSKPQIINTIM